MTALLRVDAVSVRSPAGRIVQPASFEIAAGQALTIVGETGSGKSLLAQAIVANLPAGLDAEGRVRIGEAEEEAGEAGRRQLWGRAVTVLPQEPWLALDPLMRAHGQVEEGHRLVANHDRPAATERTAADLASVGLEAAAWRYPFQLSGGMAQRLAFVAARAGGARIVVADEPTKGLDAARVGEVATLLRRGLAEGGALLAITHDLEFARRLGGEAMIMLDGEIVERGPAERVLETPEHPYARRLLAAEPGRWPRRTAAPTPLAAPVLEMRDVSASRGGRTILRDVSLAVRPGEVVGVTGPSGCGKSTLGDVALGLLRPDQGTVRRRADMARRFGKLYQDPVAAFAPRQTLRRSLADLVALHGLDDAAPLAPMDRLRLHPTLLDRLPTEMSGGELQRFSLLRVLLLRPALIVADEPSSRLDLVTQRETIDLLLSAARETGCAVLIVSHDEGLIEAVSDQRITMA